MHNLNESIAKLSEFIEVNETLDASLVFPFWIKDKNFKFLRYNQAMVDLLYPEATLDSLLAKTGWEYVQSKKLSENIVNRIKNCCNLSDKDAMYSEDITNQYFEKVITTENDELWLLTIKGRIPPKSNRPFSYAILFYLIYHLTLHYYHEIPKYFNISVLVFEEYIIFFNSSILILFISFIYI